MHSYLLPTLVLILLSGCNDIPDAPVAARSGTIRGITIADWSRDGYDRVDDAMLAEIRGTGASDIALLVTAYQSAPDASEIRIDPALTPSTTSIVRLLESARSSGLRTTLKPHVDPDDRSWRAFIEPADPGRWFVSYGTWIVSLASLADSLGCSEFIIGSELAGTLRYEKEWRDLIGHVRAVYRGRLIYAASWDEAFNVPFWDALDAIGVDFYFPVTSRNDPGRFDILAGWQPTLFRLELLARQTGKPIVLTEVGYRSIDGAGRRPWDYERKGEIDVAEQADLYWGMLTAASGSEAIDGLFIWNWPATDGGPLDDDYTPRGKPAVRELQGAWSSAK